MKLSDRKKKILKAVIESNLSSGEPISSSSIQKDYLPNVSSATIRNDLSGLEELGYLTHLHTSGGRVPTTEGYKRYVSELMDVKKLSKKDASIIEQNFNNKLINLNDIMMRSAQTISDVANYASVVYFAQGDATIIRQIKIVPISGTTQLVAVVTNFGVISEMLNILDVSEADLAEASRIMTKLFGGKPLSSLETERELISGELQTYKIIFNSIIDAIVSKEKNNKHITVAGKEKFMDYPEFEDIKNLKDAIMLMDSEEKLLPMFNNLSGDSYSIQVGGKSGTENYSIVTATYKLKDDSVFSAGIVGPVRMDYGKAVSVLKEVSNKIKNLTDKE